MAKKRDTQTYALFQGNKKVYIGTSNDVSRRADEHREQGKKFSRVEVTSRRMAEESAKQREERQLDTYRQGHCGGNPLYNKDSDG